MDGLDGFGFMEVPSILVICYFVGMALKASPLKSKWIPTVCGVTGAILGLVGIFVLPDLMGQDPFSAIAIGIVSGLAATGAHQLGTQLKK